MKKKSQGLLDGQGTHPLEVEVTQDGGNNPDSELHMRKQRVLIPYSLRVITIPHHLVRHCRRGSGAPRRGTLDRDRENLQGGIIRPPRRVSSPDDGRRRGRGPTFRVLPRGGGQPYGELRGFRFTLPFFFANTSRRDRSYPHVGLAVRGSETDGEEDLGTGRFMTKRGEDLRK